MSHSSRESDRLPRTARELRAFLERLGLRPRKRFGQNFMVDPNLLTYLVRAASVEEGDRVLEVGTGTGLLTQTLLEAGAEVVTVEADADLHGAVADLLHPASRVRPMLGDVLAGKRRLAPEVEAVVEAWGAGEYLVVANLPYNVSVPVIVNLLTLRARPRRMVVTVQKEVADRLLAVAGTAAYGRVTVGVQLRAEVTRLRNLGPNVFWPRPEVDSSAILIRPRSGADEFQASDPKAFHRFLDAAFGQRRKRLVGLLERTWPGAGDRLAAVGVAADVRAEQLSPEALLRAFEAVSAGDPEAPAGA